MKKKKPTFWWGPIHWSVRKKKWNCYLHFH